MKRIFNLAFVSLLFICTSAVAQSLEGYIQSRGGLSLSSVAHPSNDFISGTYTMASDYVDVYINSRDNLFGASIHTTVRLYKGIGNLYISNIQYLRDNDSVKPFEAFGLRASFMVELMKSIDQESFYQLQQSIIDNFGTDIQYWTGRMWALLAVNIDYYDYALKGR